MEDLAKGEMVEVASERKLGEVAKSEGGGSLSSQEVVSPVEELKIELEPIKPPEVKYKVVNSNQKADYCFFLEEGFPWESVAFKEFTGR